MAASSSLGETLPDASVSTALKAAATSAFHPALRVAPASWATAAMASWIS